MILYCAPCCDLHELTFVQAERILYAFQDRLTHVSIADPVEHEDIDRPLFLDSRTGKISYICFKDMLEFSGAGNENGDWTSEMVATRRERVRDSDPAAPSSISVKGHEWDAPTNAKVVP